MSQKIIQPYKRYGKSMSSILSIKQSFIENNDICLEDSEKIRNIYIKQPLRKFCKLCNAEISNEPYYCSHGTSFFMCENCGHINGEFEDGEQFTKDLYMSGMYGNTYQEQNRGGYIRRVEAIYVPKVQFLIDVLERENINYKEYNYLDVGAGAGFMVEAYSRHQLNAQGIEIDRHQIEYGNEMLGKKCLEAVLVDEMAYKIAHTNCEVVSFIGVLEHIVNLREILQAIKDNSNIKYIFFSVPKFALSCILEIVFPEVYPRHIGGGNGHTHLFTDESLQWIYKEYDFVPIGEWRFGTDIMDLYRDLSVMLEKSSASDKLISNVSKFFTEQTDAIQMIVDKTDLTSEIHVVLKKA